MEDALAHPYLEAYVRPSHILVPNTFTLILISLSFSRSSFLDLFSHLSICSTNVQHLRHLIFHQYATYNTKCHGFVCSHHGTTISLVTRLAYLSPSRFVVVPFGSRVIWDFTFFFLSGWHVNSSHAVSSGSRTCATFFLVG